MASKKIYLVNRDFQLRYAGAAILVGTMSTILTSLLILYPLYAFEILQVPRFVPPAIMLAMIVAAICNIALVALMAVIVTNRIAGPMYSLTRHMRRVGAGFFNGKMQVRKGDELRYVVRNFNDMTSGLRHVVEGDVAYIATLRSMAQEASPGRDSRMIAALDEFEARMVRRIVGKEAAGDRVH